MSWREPRSRVIGAGGQPELSQEVSGARERWQAEESGGTPQGTRGVVGRSQRLGPASLDSGAQGADLSDTTSGRWVLGAEWSKQ